MLFIGLNLKTAVRLTELCANIETLKSAIHGIETHIVALTSRSYGKPQKTGVPIRALPLLACPLCQKPLQPECVDLHISFLGESEYQLYHQRHFIQDAGKWMKPTATVLGAAHFYKPDSRSVANIRIKYRKGPEPA